jgi:hypothetical protein
LSAGLAGKNRIKTQPQENDEVVFPERRERALSQETTMFGFLFGNKRPASRPRPSFRASFRPHLETLEGRDLPSGFVPVSQDLAPQNLFQSPAQGQVQTIQVQQAPIQFHTVSLGITLQTLESIGAVSKMPQEMRSAQITKADIDTMSNWIQSMPLPPEQIKAAVSGISQSLQPFDHLSVKGPTVPHLAISVDNLKPAQPPSTDLSDRIIVYQRTGGELTTAANNNPNVTSGITRLVTATFSDGPQSGFPKSAFVP